jgi:YHS domain-containing protein
MFRIIFEFLLFMLVVFVGRAILGSVLKGISKASSNSFQSPGANRQAGSASPDPRLGGELHKDPVCGTYVAESTPFRRQSAGQTFYYCSSDCREKHALVAR